MDPLIILSSTLIGFTIGYTLMEGTYRVFENILSRTVGCIEGLTYGQGMGVLFRVKKNVYIKSNKALLRLPSFCLPNLETDVSYFYGEENRFDKRPLIGIPGSFKNSM